MYRYIKADQFIGAMFSSLIPRKLYEIDIDNICKLEKKINSKLREDNKTILCASIKELYSTIDDYSNFFEIKSDRIKIKENYSTKFNKINERARFEEKLKNYFVAGIPEDINYTFVTTIDQYILNDYVGSSKENEY